MTKSGPSNKFQKNAIKARAEARAKEIQPATLKRRIGYLDEKDDDDDEDMPDASKMKFDDMD
jgi:hypothetical protein